MLDFLLLEVDAAKEMEDWVDFLCFLFEDGLFKLADYFL